MPNFAETLYKAHAFEPERVFLRSPDGNELSYGETVTHAARLAAVLVAAGAEPGERVLVYVDKSPHAVAVYLACLHAGVIHVPVNPTFTIAELDHYINDADPALIVAHPRGADALVDHSSTATILTLDQDGSGTLTEWAEFVEPLPMVNRSDSDVAALLYTSGTTGRPKGAALTHANVRHNAEALHEIWRFDRSDVLLHTLPIFHVHGLFVALHCAMLAAAPVVLLPRFSVDAVIASLPQSTVMMGVPTQYRLLLDDERFDATVAGPLRLFTCGSAPLTSSVFDEFTSRTGQRICERYGMSEAGIITSNPYDGDRLAGTVGYPLPGVELRIVDEAGASCPPGTTGSIEVSGPHLFREYWRRLDETETSHRDDGFFVTGDIGCLEPDGRLTIQGRSSDMIITGAENVYPKEVEMILDAAPGIVESAVIGLPHPTFGEAVSAVLVVRPGYDENDARAALESLARYKHPKLIVTVDELPRNPMGKVMKAELRRRFDSLYSSPFDSTAGDL